MDVLKGLACMLIVAHHLVFYGPMSTTAYPLASELMDWLFTYGRMAVQVFLVLGGYLAASTLAPDGVARFEGSWQQVQRRFVRLSTPYLAALLFGLLAAAVARYGMEHPSIPSEPSLPQLLAHVFMLQDLLGYEALSAGVWYVAIDFQLFVLAVLVFSLARRWSGGLSNGPSARWLSPVLVVGLTSASLLYFNLDANFDTLGLYFAGAYGMGMLAFWAGRSARPWAWLVALALLGLTALVLDYRERIAVALVTTLVLGVLQASPWARQWSPLPRVQRLGQMSYSVFLVHFSVCLLVNTVFSQYFPAQPWMNAAGMLLAFTLSLRSGQWLYRNVETRLICMPSALRLQGSFLAAGLLLMGLKAL
ncbi:acyltransferase family protein [Rhodoferax sp.]|uniref:acyltransferase family protein n=1 Tax=Rhodoferax sp. TaxID=50421 RepID=UPI0025DCD9BD|nr:acyltransferase family protein [Rhodoferax sp.]